MKQPTDHKNAAMACHLCVQAHDFLRALNDLRPALKYKRGQGEALLDFFGNQARIVLSGGEVSVPASGYWPGLARFPVILLEAIRKMPPAGNQFIITYADGRIRIANTSVACSWSDAPIEMIELPLGSTYVDMLRLLNKYSEDLLIESGLGKQIKEARKKRDTRILRALVHLHELGITEQDLVQLVDAKMASAPAQLRPFVRATDTLER